jgi:hypothetical protein
VPTVEGRHFYRFKYLKSDHWQNLRLEKLASVDACCERCGTRDLSNDVHHLNYRKLYDVQLDDLAVLCRRCHDLVHEALELFREKINSSERNRFRRSLRFIKRTAKVKKKARNAAIRERKPGWMVFSKRDRTPQEIMDRDAAKEIMRLNFSELGPVFKDLRKNGAFSFLIVQL